MDFTREPIIETVITPRDGCKLVVRSSKAAGQEEHFVDAVEVISFGSAIFFRSLERPKMFLVPASDYEVLEVREARMVLKNVGIDRAIKIGGGREGGGRQQKEQAEKTESAAPQPNAATADEKQEPTSQEKPSEERNDKKRDRRRNARRRRGRELPAEEEAAVADGKPSEEGGLSAAPSSLDPSAPLAQQVVTTSMLTSLLAPPPMLISETIARYKENDAFKQAFYSKDELPQEEGEEEKEDLQSEQVPLPQPEYGTFEVSEEEEEAIYKMRKQQLEEEGLHENSEENPAAFFQESPLEPTENQTHPEEHLF